MLFVKQRKKETNKKQRNKDLWRALNTCNPLSNVKVNITVRKNCMLLFQKQMHMTKIVLAALTIPYNQYSHTHIIKHLSALSAKKLQTIVSFLYTPSFHYLPNWQSRHCLMYPCTCETPKGSKRV